MVIKMKKMIVMMAIAALMVCSFWGVVANEADFQFVNGLRNMVNPCTIVYSGETPDDGIPGGPPGIPG